MEKCPRAFCVAYSVICHNPCDVLSSVWHRGDNLLVWVIDTLLEVLTGTSEAPGIARRTECAVCVCKCVGAHVHFSAQGSLPYTEGQPRRLNPC